MNSLYRIEKESGVPDILSMNNNLSMVHNSSKPVHLLYTCTRV